MRMKFRSIRQCLLELKAVDPGTAISEYALRRWVREGKIPHQKSGNRIFIDVDALTQILSIQEDKL